MTGRRGLGVQVPKHRQKARGRFSWELTPKAVQLKDPVEAAAQDKPLVPRDAEVETPVQQERQPYDGNTAYNLYLREVGQTKLLTVEEENQLAARIKKGDKKAREQMIKANLRLVVKIAREYENYEIPLLHPINDTNMLFMKP